MASTYLTSGNLSIAGNQQKWTFSAWIKKATTGANNGFMSYWVNSTNYFIGKFTSTDQLQFGNVDGGAFTTELKTTANYRDTNGFYHVVYHYNSAEATSSDRAKMWVNGEQISNFADEQYPSQNANTKIPNSGYPIFIGVAKEGASNMRYFDGVMTHVHFCDGYAYEASDFGETDATTGIWKIKTSPSVTYGTNGFFILKDGNSVTDQSGNGNNFTVAGGTLTNTEDNPSNVFATLNALDVFAGTPAGLLNGNNTYNKTATGIGTNGARIATIAPSSGKWYWEFKPADSVSVILGFARTDHLNNTGTLDGWIGEDIGTFGIRPNGSKIIAGIQTSGSYSFTANDVIGFAMDLDNNKFYAHKNGTYYNSGDPTSGATGTGSIGNITAGNNYAPLVQNNSYNETNVVHCNFGNGYFGTTAVSSAGTNASGNGIFEYDVPTGYTALSTKGLNL